MQPVIYRIQNKVTGKVYIGSSTNLGSRLYEHQGHLKGHRHPNVQLQGDWCKYGIDQFEFGIIEHCEHSNLREREQHWLDYYKSSGALYNIIRSVSLPYPNLYPIAVSKGTHDLVRCIAFDNRITMREVVEKAVSAMYREKVKKDGKNKSK